MTIPDQKKLNCIIEAYDRFIPRKLMQLTEKSDITQVALGDHIEKRMTVFFSDIWNFTALSESLTPKENFNFLNSYLSQLEPVVSRNQGVIDKYIGDAVMGLFFGGADSAVQGALGMLDWLVEYNTGRKRAGYIPIEIGIGLNTGILMLGTIGSEHRMDYTVIGDAVNLASRIEHLSRAFGIHLIISEHTYRNLAEPDRYTFRFIDRLAPRGKSHPVSLYELFGRDPPELLNMKIKTRFLFEEAVANYHYRKISAAEKLFEHCFSKAPEDNVVALYRERCRQYRRHGKHHSAKELQEEIQWLPEYCTGIPEVDKRNKKLFTFAHRLVKAVDNKNKERDSDEGLQFLHDYANTHFAEEEQFLESIGYPFLENHQLQHRRFIKDLILMENEIALHKLVSSLYARFRIHILIVGWIIHHILGEDLHYARWYRNRSER